MTSLEGKKLTGNSLLKLNHIGLFVFLLFIVGIFNSAKASWYDTRWNQRIKITINKAQINGTVTDFPVFVRLSDLPAGFFDGSNINGSDLRVTTSDEVTELAREVVSLNRTANDGELWFKAPSLSSTTNGVFYIYFNNTTATAPLANSTFGSQNVWSNGFVAVYHMNALTNGTASVLDSTSFARACTPFGGMTAGSDLLSGKSGNSIDFDGTDDFLNCGTSTNINGNFLTMTAWVYPTNVTGGDKMIINKENSYEYAFRPATLMAAVETAAVGSWDWGGSLGPAITNTWQYSVFIHDNTQWTFYLNNNTQTIAPAGSQTGAITPYATNLRIANRTSANAPLAGRIDEVRIASKARNRNWITTEYNNQNAPATFYTVGTIENQEPQNWSNRIQITIPRSLINGSVMDFPVYVDLNNFPNTFFTNCKGSGADIRVTSSDGITQLPTEIVSLSQATTNGEMWFRAPSLSSASNASFFVYYGNNGATMPNAASSIGSQRVWSNGFVAVYHMNAVTNGTASVLDSTSFANHGTPRGNMSTTTGGRIGTSITFDGTNDNVNIGSAISTILNGNSFSVSAWDRRQAINARHYFIGRDISGPNNQHLHLGYRDTNFFTFSFWANDLNSVASYTTTNIWRYSYATYNTNTNSRRLYQDGVLNNSDTSPSDLSGTGNYFLGRADTNFFNGQLDEIKISNKERNRNWVATEYNNQNNASAFVQVGSPIGPEHLADWAFRIPLTINKAQVNGSVTDFPVYVDLNNFPNSFFTSAKSDGSDIRITTSDGVTRVPLELVSYSAATTNGELWFRAPSLTSTSNGTFYVYYGNANAGFPAANSTYGSQQVWSNGYVSVWHLNQEPSNASNEILESSYLSNHMTSVNMAGTEIRQGKLGNSVNFDGSDDYTNSIYQFNGSTISVFSNFNLSMWAKPNATRPTTAEANSGTTGTSGQRYAITASHGQNSNTGGTGISIGTSGISVFHHKAGYMPSPLVYDTTISGWNHVSINTIANANVLYVNSNLVRTGLTTTLRQFPGAGIAGPPGYGYYSGEIDEIRVSRKSRSRNWITTEYNNQNSVSSFVTVGSPAGPENLADWAFRIPLTINKAQVNGSVTDFPVFIDLNNFPNSFFTSAKSDGSDIRITTSDGATRVPVELVSYSAATTNGELWFRAPSLTSTANGTFYVYYGNSNALLPPANTAYGSQQVWSNGFVAVYHMNSLTNGTASVLDSTSFARHGTPIGGMSTLSAGKTGGSVTFDGTNDHIDIGSSISNIFNGNSFSVSIWDRRQAIGAIHYAIGRNTNGPANQHLAFGYGGTNNFMFAFWANDLSSPSTYTTTNTWRYWHGTYNTSSNS
ncbi:MAG: DUF2341 domain-containing protein, partial [Candidatus Caenarcaniphilales bacterium]|nr:DUF2341 domain-containing protein [Candidatus Caenarcaniphilales bacterium]